ncbi:tRNA (adenosine(37)-N6)-threonylcarbamoyltransferase complex ATPase subunit type 1 TsaE [Bacillus sp. FJAT-50079]|uniref:tRNA (adenosine(37)-N6)-threonylcarbamoyltransferase complex ATPase subunit type 1 TsaE n=1 Tax=Bacillus sp. FJAT-50079 TaxID=2833577 RepID=UPI001BC994CD|nr:tRNA (adenosine(37)-N6)-threonylcarbamoyltransferase complex ATPase subunit type 1 TsaE [Bacillus sp. FJAT-50079]MBS4210507.1 tRNA (adenosine(37)-N6)-threonylcarbamoyltransferase complex ATPase subunit type 1 TsaE [Bacillus sp. FJAT-50079]
MPMYEIVTNETDETHVIAKRLGSLLEKGDVILLEGDLGAGKTTFTKGIAEGLQIKRTVNSPTFTIIKEYMGNMPLYHMDVYRVSDAYEDLGFDEYFYGEGVTVVEWAHLIEDQLPPQHLVISLYHEGENRRKLHFQPVGARYEALCKELWNEIISD